MASNTTFSPSQEASANSFDNCIAATISVYTGTVYQHSCAGRIWSVSEGFVRILTDQPLGVGVSVLAAFDGCQANGEVVFCQQWPGIYNVGVQLIQDHNLRREPRFPVQLKGQLTVLAEQGPQRLAVDVVDVSASGLGLVSKERLSVGACVEVSCGPGVIFGEIRYCEPNELGLFRVGMKMFHLIARNPEAVPPRKSRSKLIGWLSGTQRKSTTESESDAPG